MAAVTLEITPDLESRLRQAAAREGLDTRDYILSTLRERLFGLRQAAGSNLGVDEAALLQEINRGLPAKTWQRYEELKAKRRAEILMSAEQAELIAVSDEIETMNARRMEHLIQLAHLRKTSVDALMDDLGIKSPIYE